MNLVLHLEVLISRRRVSDAEMKDTRKVRAKQILKRA